MIKMTPLLLLLLLLLLLPYLNFYTYFYYELIIRYFGNTHTNLL